MGRGHRQELQDVGNDGDAAGGSVGAESGAAQQMADSGDAAKIQHNSDDYKKEVAAKITR